MLTVGCGDDDGLIPPADAGGTGSGDGSTTGAHGALVVSVAGDLASLEDGQALDSASLSVMLLRASNDRGGSFEPTVSPAPIDLATGASFDIPDVAPATYASVSMHLAPNGSAPSFAMRVVEASRARTFDVQLSTALDVDARCASPIVLAPGGTAHLQVTLRIRELTSRLDEGTAPAPVDGIVHVDEVSAPELTRELLSRLGEAFELQCDSSEHSG